MSESLPLLLSSFTYKVPFRVRRQRPSDFRPPTRRTQLVRLAHRAVRLSRLVRARSSHLAPRARVTGRAPRVLRAGPHSLDPLACRTPLVRLAHHILLLDR